MTGRGQFAFELAAVIDFDIARRAISFVRKMGVI